MPFTCGRKKIGWLRPELAARLAAWPAVLPAGFAPKNRDGEVAQFQCLPFPEALRLLRETEQFTLDATLAAMDYFERRNLRP